MSLTDDRPRSLLNQPTLLGRIRAVTVPNHPGLVVKIRDSKFSGQVREVQWVEFMSPDGYADCGWELVEDMQR